MGYGITLTRYEPAHMPDQLNQPGLMRVDASSPVGDGFDGGVFVLERITNPPGAPTPYRDSLVMVCKIGDMLLPLGSPITGVNPPWFRSSSTGNFTGGDIAKTYGDITARVKQLLNAINAADAMTAASVDVLTSD